MKLWEALLNQASPRYLDWRVILDGDDVPLKSPIPRQAQLEGDGNDEVYILDLDRLTGEQFERLVFLVARKFNAPHAQVWQAIKAEGFPIRSSDVIVAFDLRAFI